jgi:polyhydroxyalkanoate synthesis regulator phasin
MRERVKFLKDKSELKDHMDVNLLVEDYDGKVTIEQSRNYVNEMLDKWEDAVSLVGQIDAEFENIESDREAGGSSEFEFGPIGSFKKLEID